MLKFCRGEDPGYGKGLGIVGSGPASPQPEPAEEQPARAGVGRLGTDWDQVYVGLAVAGCAMVWAGLNIAYPTDLSSAGFIFPLAGSRSW